MARKFKKQRLEIIYPKCAGIDIGSREHWVAVDPDCCDEPVRCFSAFTDSLQALADWLHSLDIETVAMEATGVYWIPLFEILDQRGFDVQLVNSRATRQVSGRKSDVLDCQWIWQLMSHGLLKGAFRPDDDICILRSLVRQRDNKVKEQSRCIAHMQKALTQMNIQLDAVVSDLMGKTGTAILRAIVAGERDAYQLAKLRERQLKILPSLSDESVEPVKPLRSPYRTTIQQRALHQALHQIMGMDLTAIPTIGVDTALIIASEVDPDLSRFATCAHFCSWLGVAPPTRISGGKQLPGRAPKVLNRAGQALRQAASNARNSQSFIGASHRARLVRMDGAAAVKATAHQLTRLIYAMLTKGRAYVEQGMDVFEARSQDRQIRALQRKAHKLGLQLIEAA